MDTSIPRADGAILKLNLGAGAHPMDGYQNLDIKTGQSIYPLEFPDSSADEIRASHVFEHFSHQHSEIVLREWVRVLKPGGVIKIAVPDFDSICKWHATGQIDGAEYYLMGGHIDGDDCHGAAFTRKRICQLFHACGLVDVRDWASDHADCSSLPISLNMQARKPVASGIQYDGIEGVYPSARYGPSMTHRCIHDVLAEMQIKIRTTGGCFWNQHICPAMEASANEPGCKYVLTFDYDGVFTAQDIRTLYEIMETHPHIDALSPLQSHRGLDTPLFTLPGSNGQLPAARLDDLAFPASTTHFGLTLIRAEKLRTLQHPWMVGVPGEGGRWNDSRTDPDIYFWRHWAEAGNTIYISPRVGIGHIDEIILWASAKDLTPIYQKSSDYLKYGKPVEAK